MLLPSHISCWSSHVGSFWVNCGYKDIGSEGSSSMRFFQYIQLFSIWRQVSSSHFLELFNYWFNSTVTTTTSPLHKTCSQVSSVIGLIPARFTMSSINYSKSSVSNFARKDDELKLSTCTRLLGFFGLVLLFAFFVGLFFFFLNLKYLLIECLHLQRFISLYLNWIL